MTPDGGPRVRKPGRPTKFNPDRAAKILKALRGAAALDTAAAYAGVHRDTLHEWLRLGDAEELGQHRDFSDAVHEALAYAEVNASASVAKAMQKQWQAAAWYLERRNPREWGPRIKVTLEQELDAAIERLEAVLPPEQFEAAVRALVGEPGSIAPPAPRGGEEK